jgi:endoglucanase
VLDWIERYNTEPVASNPCSKTAVRAPIDKPKAWSDYYGRPLHFGEFGCFTTADAASRANFYRAFREAAEKAGVGWALWDWKAAFRYWDEKAGKPEPGMHEALFEKTRG